MNIFNLTAGELGEFKHDSVQVLEQLRSSLSTYSKDPKFKTQYALLFRTFHGLKSASLVLGLGSVQDHFSKLETSLVSCKSKQAFQSREIEFFIRGIDAARVLLEGGSVSFDEKIDDPSTGSDFEAMSSSPNTADLTANESGLVYIVDDEPDIAEILASMLESIGLKTVMFTNPIKMLDAVHQMVPDLVLSDMKMPELTGLDILKRVKAINSDVPVIFISGYLDTPNLLESIDSGVYAAIEKPFDMNKVVDVCTNAIRLSQVNKLLSRSINLILFQFTDLKDYLLSQGKNDLAHSIEDELKCLIEQRRKFREAKKAS